MVYWRNAPYREKFARVLKPGSVPARNQITRMPQRFAISPSLLRWTAEQATTIMSVSTASLKEQSESGGSGYNLSISPRIPTRYEGPTKF